jgi:hypothetical protein
VPRRSAPRHAARRSAGPPRAAVTRHGQYPPIAAPGPAPDRAASPFRGTGRPAFLTCAAAAALLTAAGLTVGVTAGPTAAADAITGHATPASDARISHAAASGDAAPFLGASAAAGATGRLVRSPAATGMAYPLPSQSAAAPSRSRDQAGHRAAGTAGSGTARHDGTGRPPQRGKPSAEPSPTPSPSQSAAAEQPFEIYDSATPAAIPAGVMCATYATGDYAVPAAEMAGRPTIWIDAWGTDPAASVLDVEPGDATPSMVPQWVSEHLALEPSDNARIYTMLDEWPAVQQAVSTLPASMQARVRYWIADPTGVPHMVPGASATQWYWGPNYDISTADPGF